jgi:hypothetical protein
MLVSRRSVYIYIEVQIIAMYIVCILIFKIVLYMYISEFMMPFHYLTKESYAKLG